MSRPKERLTWDESRGSVSDGPRRYLLMRPDVLMGALARLDGPAQTAWLQALAASAQQHGAASLRDYRAMAPEVGIDALLRATADAAADLGWGRWTLRHDEARALTLEIAASPFAAGWHAAAGGAPAPGPVCAAARGMLAGLAEIVLGSPVQAEESECSAMRPLVGTAVAVDNREPSALVEDLSTSPRCRLRAWSAA